MSSVTKRKTRKRIRNRSRDRTHNQHGGAEDDQTLESWLRAAAELYETQPIPEQSFATLRRGPELLMKIRKGAMLPDFYPPYLGDLMVSIASGLGEQRITSGSAFTLAMQGLKEKEKDFYALLIAIETTLQISYMSLVRRESTSTIPSIDLSIRQTGKTPFVWIAYANLPYEHIDPVAPTLISEELVKEELTLTQKPSLPE